ncbi:P-loop containing nucleoside triphosphate hydrolase protein [Lindgomyces ingoldianus]|uniref:P-loop containing nucleoside triphosphate hydrolase protein n=1 Tax=Lindgomyces ingoldianus TaxID=673940 RepID=A0ACB6QWX7_9PLEO|nr:P-loop containing nucleoside triphosphate hydrolase protein [Lindgomyces ingoldianus]KAF2470706.1 P-loop containing nucleoside triphosphate hydrolase protein [Lindgomyces ingoldianus]
MTNAASLTTRRVLLVGISGPSSSGKTTLSRLLRDIFPSTFILHLDDFYLTDTDIPVRDGIQDWDCIESLNLHHLHDALSFIKTHGNSPPSLISKEDQNSVGDHGVEPAVIEQLKQHVQTLLEKSRWNTPIAIVDGFLLFSESMADIRQMFDLKLFLRTSYETARGRREARSGYVTLEGFWEDPPGYVDRIVWPNYVKDHAFLFQGNDVHAELNESVCRDIGINGMPRNAEESMTDCLTWAVQILESIIQQTSPLGNEID